MIHNKEKTNNKYMWTLEQLQKSDCQTEINGNWVHARPENFKPSYISLLKRLYYAWYVVCGRAETFVWHAGQ